MNQKEYTDYVIPKLLEAYPQFLEYCTAKPGDIVDIDYKSAKGKLTLWVTTQDREITIGITGDGGGDWHTHMSLFGANTPDEELEAATTFIQDIITDVMPIVHSGRIGYFPMYPDDPVEPDEVVWHWSDL